MKIEINISHTFEDAERFAAFAPELKAFLDRFFSGPASPPAAPETRGMMPRESANVIAPPAVSPPSPKQPAHIPATASEESSDEVAQEAPAGDALAAPEPETPAAPTKRKRRTKAEMAAAREAGAVAPLPSASGFGGPATVNAPAPAPVVKDLGDVDPFDPFAPAPTQKPAAASGVTHADVKAAFSPLLMNDDADQHIIAILARHGLTKVNESADKPHLWAPLIADFKALQAQLDGASA